MTPYERRLAKYFKYNRSAKGQERNRRYEEKHPERSLRWEPLRDLIHKGAAADKKEAKHEEGQAVPSDRP